MRPLPGQMVLNLFPEEQQKRANPLEGTIRWLVEEHLCPEADVRPYVERAFREFGRPEAVSRAHELPYFYSSKRRRTIPCAPESLGMFDASIGCQVFWDRCWAALWIGPEEAANVMEWRYCQYKAPYTGAPVDVWYIDNEGREVRRPYEG